MELHVIRLNENKTANLPVGFDPIMYINADIVSYALFLLLSFISNILCVKNKTENSRNHFLHSVVLINDKLMFAAVKLKKYIRAPSISTIKTQ